MYGNFAKILLLTALSGLITFNAGAVAANPISITLSDPEYLGGSSLNVLMEITNESNKTMRVFSVYSNDEIPVNDPERIVNQTYPFIGSVDPYYSNYFSYVVLVRGYLFSDYRYVQGLVSITEIRFRKTGVTINKNYASNVIDMKNELTSPQIITG
jgi:hypothetical protein